MKKRKNKNINNIAEITLEPTQNSSLDERTMIREQERMAKAAKRKKRKKWKILAAVLVAVLVITSVWYAGWGRKMLAVNTAAATVKIEKSLGQTVVYARIDEVNGNEITYTIAEEVKAEETASTDGITDTYSEAGAQGDAAGTTGRPARGDKTDTAGNGEGGSSAETTDIEGDQNRQNAGGMQMPSGGEMPDMSQIPSGGEMPDMSQIPSGGEMPDMSQIPSGGEMPDMSQIPSGGEMPDMSRMPSGAMTGSTDSNMIVYDGNTYRVGTETVTKYIPVGTDVTTKLGTVTTFSRLAEGDYVALVTDKDGDKDVIVAVYIIG